MSDATHVGFAVFAAAHLFPLTAVQTLRRWLAFFVTSSVNVPEPSLNR